MAAHASHQEIDFDRLTRYSIQQVSQWLRSGAVSATRLTEHAIEQHQASPEKWNAYVHWQPEQALACARTVDQMVRSDAEIARIRKLLGIPISIKDNYALSECPLYVGGPEPLPDHLNQTGPVVDAIRKQRAVIMGKTHTVQFAYGGLGVNNHWGTPWNPFDSESHRVPGGSSAGAGISLAEGSAMLAMGSDTAGSVRIPASFTGHIGFKPSKGRWSTEGIIPLSRYLDVPGVLARRTCDLMAAFSAIDPECESYELLRRDVDRSLESGFTLGVADNLLWSSSESSIVESCEQALDLTAASDKAELADVAFPEARQAVDFRNSGGTVSAELIEFFQSELPQWEHSLDPIISDRIKIAGDIDAVEFLKRVRRLSTFASTALPAFSQCDAIVCPTVPVSPPRMSELEPMSNYRSINLLVLQNTCIANILNLCAATVPTGTDANGMPVGLQILAPHGDDIKLLAIADFIHRRLLDSGALPWVDGSIAQ